MNTFITKLSQQWPNVIGSIIGGIIVAILTSLFLLLRSSIRGWRFKRILGSDIDIRGQFRIIYAELSLPKIFDQNGKKIDRPYEKQPRKSGSRSPDCNLCFKYGNEKRGDPGAKMESDKKWIYILGKDQD